MDCSGVPECSYNETRRRKAECSRPGVMKPGETYDECTYRMGEQVCSEICKRPISKITLQRAKPIHAVFAIAAVICVVLLVKRYRS